MPVPIDVFDSKILIVDDQESNLRLLEHTLRRGAYSKVTTTTDPVGVCALHRQNRYDLILLDVRMPAMDGFEVMDGLGKMPRGERAAVLVLTADPAQMVPALAAGASGFLSKPFVLTEVLLQVRLMLETRAGLPSAPAADTPVPAPSASRAM